MTRFNLALVLVAGVAARPHLPSPMTWMRDKYDSRLDTDLKEYLGQILREDETEPEKEITYEDVANIKRGDGKVVKFHDDTIVSDYISVSSWFWVDDGSNQYFPP